MEKKREKRESSAERKRNAQVKKKNQSFFEDHWKGILAGTITTGVIGGVAVGVDIGTSVQKTDGKENSHVLLLFGVLLLAISLSISVAWGFSMHGGLAIKMFTYGIGAVAALSIMGGTVCSIMALGLGTGGLASNAEVISTYVREHGILLSNNAPQAYTLIFAAILMVGIPLTCLLLWQFFKQGYKTRTTIMGAALVGGAIAIGFGSPALAAGNWNLIGQGNELLLVGGILITASLALGMAWASWCMFSGQGALGNVKTSTKILLFVTMLCGVGASALTVTTFSLCGTMNPTDIFHGLSANSVPVSSELLLATIITGSVIGLAGLIYALWWSGLGAKMAGVAAKCGGGGDAHEEL